MEAPLAEPEVLEHEEHPVIEPQVEQDTPPTPVPAPDAPVHTEDATDQDKDTEKDSAAPTDVDMPSKKSSESPMASPGSSPVRRSPRRSVGSKRKAEEEQTSFEPAAIKQSKGETSEASPPASPVKSDDGSHPSWWAMHVSPSLTKVTSFFTSKIRRTGTDQSASSSLVTSK